MSTTVARARRTARPWAAWSLGMLLLAAPLSGLVVLVSAQPAGAAIFHYNDPSISSPDLITVGPDGALWFVNEGNSSIGRITTSGTVTNFSGAGINIADTSGIVSGPDGALWFVDGNAIGRITTGGVVTTYSDPSIFLPLDITVGPDGALWFTNAGNNSIGRITTAGVVTNYTGFGISVPGLITAGPDGALWFTNINNDSIGRITTTGTVTNYTDASISHPVGITTGPDGALWFANAFNASIGRITTGGAVTNYTDPSLATPGVITPGPDGALWFADSQNDLIGRITTSGAITTYANTQIGNPAGLVAGPDGALWFTDFANFSIGQLTITAPAAVAPGAPTVTAVKAGDRTVSVSFTPGADGSPSTTGYVASCDPTDGGPAVTTTGSGSPIALSGLSDGDDYTCAVFAFNDAGNSPASNRSETFTPSRGPTSTATCTNTTSCDAALPSVASLVAPAEAVHVTGTPSSSVGSVTLSTSFGSLGCRSIGPRQQPIHTLTDRGFAPTTRLNVTVTREIASATSVEQVCFNSDVAFLSQESPTVKRAGSGLLLGCARVANVAPCVTSSRQVGANIVVKFVVPGGDPRFYIELPKGRQAWLDGAGVATAGKRY